MGLRELDLQPIDAVQPRSDIVTEYRLEVVLSVNCARQLWSSAFRKALAQTAMTYSDIQELIGSRDDPSIEACLALLAEPTDIPGCVLDEFQVLPASAAPLH